MFEEHREKKAAKAYEKSLAQWQEQRAGHAELLKLAQEFNGSDTSAIMLGSGEAVFFTVTGVSLIEDRRGKGTYQGGSTGVSIPIGTVGGHSVRYRVGATRGHFEQGALAPTAIDNGTVYVTNKRMVFLGGKQTRECAFAKLLGFQHDDSEGSTTFSVSNRQKPTTIHYGPNVAPAFDFRLDLALAHFRGTIGDLVGQLQQDLAEIDATRPIAPAGDVAHGAPTS